VIDGRVMLEFFKALWYDRSTLVDKKRRVYHVDDLEVVIDDVKNLGVFVEVEAQWEYESVDDAKADIVNFLKGLWLDRIDKQQRGYVSMLWNMEVNFGEEMLL